MDDFEKQDGKLWGNNRNLINCTTTNVEQSALFSRHVAKSKNLGGQVVMRRIASSQRHLLINKNLGGQLACLLGLQLWWHLIILTKAAMTPDLLEYSCNLSTVHTTTPRVLTSLKFPIKIKWSVELCHQLCFSDMFKPFVSLKVVKMLSKIPKYSHASVILDIKRSKWRLTSDLANERFK